MNVDVLAIKHCDNSWLFYVTGGYHISSLVPGFPHLIGFLKTMGHDPAVLSEVVQDALENPDHGDHDTAQDQVVIDHQDRLGWLMGRLL